MICPDVNLLLYATFRSFREHEKAKSWWDGALSGGQAVRLGHVVVLGFLRLSTSSKVFENPLTVQQAVSVVEGWLAQPNVDLLAPAPGHWTNLRERLAQGGVGANLTTDAHLAALASDYGLAVCSNDADFARFPGLNWVNPLDEP